MANKEYFSAVGRRKESTAVVKLFPKGTGNLIVKSASEKERTVQEYFGGNLYLLQNTLLPFETMGKGVMNQFDAEITVKWGGIAGQADAIKLWISRALIERNSDARLTLKPHGLLKRDPRIKERKKPGLKKARKRPTWSKR